MKGLSKEIVKVGLNVLQSGYVVVARRMGLIDFPVPPNSSLRKTSSKTIQHYYISGTRCYLPIATMALHYKIDLDGPIAILDFGCGVARELLHFVKHYPKPRYFACDVDITSVDFVRNNFPVDCYCNSFNPPLRYEPAYFDMIYSVSTFSHLSPEDHGPWLRELLRIIKPGGYCFLTIEGRAAFKMMQGTFADMDGERMLRERGVLYKEYDWLESERRRRHRIPVAAFALGIDSSYGTTVMTPEYIRDAWPASGFEVADIIEAIIDHRQDLVVLRKNPGRQVKDRA